MDYDKTTIPESYDAARVITPDAMRQWIDLVARHAPPAPQLIVDVGCGTGRFTQPLAERFPARILGIDPSEKMLEAARGKSANGRVQFTRGSAERLPLEDASADLIFMSMMLHHIEDKPGAARECRRVLRPGGRLCIRNTTRDSTYPQQRFFPGLRAIIDSQLQSRDEIIAMFESAGLHLRAWEVVPQRIAANWHELAEKFALRADSFNVRLPDDDFHAGMAALRAHAAASDPNEGIIDDIHFFAFEA